MASKSLKKWNKFLKTLSIVYFYGFFMILIMPSYVAPDITTLCYETAPQDAIVWNGELLYNKTSNCQTISEEEYAQKMSRRIYVHGVSIFGIIGWTVSMYHAKRSERKEKTQSTGS